MPSKRPEKKKAKAVKPVKAERWTTSGLLDYFNEIDRNMEDRSFAFILGAGASVASGIPSGRQLVDKWLAELQTRLGPDSEEAPLPTWATAERLGISGFDYERAEEFYPQVYERRFRDDPDEGFAYLEAEMASKEPSFGYSVLAQLLSKTRHRVAITTNFDNLIADALSLYAKEHPLVCGHESLAGFVRSRMRRPLVAKVHRDLLLAPLNDPDGTAHLAAPWQQALLQLFKHCTPLFVGYGGNDGSLMGFLENLPEGTVLGRLLWCYWEQGGTPSERVEELVVRHRGAVVPILGFDELMLELGERLGLGLVGDDILRWARERQQVYEKQVSQIRENLGRLAKSTTEPDEVRSAQQALAATIERGSGAWGSLIKAASEPNAERKRARFETLLKTFPDNYRTLLSYARFAESDLGDRELAENLYRRALEVAPSSNVVKLDVARFLAFSLRNYDEAESLLRTALEANPADTNLMTDLAIILLIAKGDISSAELLDRRALELKPDSHITLSNLAVVLGLYGTQHTEASQLFARSLEENNDPDTRSNYAALLLEMGKPDEAAEQAAIAWRDKWSREDRFGARIAAIRGLAARARGLRDDEALGRLKTILSAWLPRGPHIPLDRIIDTVRDSLADEDVELYKLLAEVLAGERETRELESNKRWTSVSPIDLSVEWPQEQEA
ncbi:hypothetical protein KAW64_14450 [bacterium]|nr:hypothetical protein [bacterium]